jgi:hypothetical protein
MKVNQEKLYELYMEKVYEIAEECDWKTHFDARDIVGIIALVLEQNPHLIEQ